MPKRIRSDFESYELRGAQVRVARKARLCDHHKCAKHGCTIAVGERYAYVSTGLAFCDWWFTDDDVVEYAEGVVS